MVRSISRLKYFLFPHPENDHKPHILHEHALLSIFTSSLFLLLISFTLYTVLRETYFGNRLLTNQIIFLTNEVRVKNRLHPLYVNTQLSSAAIYKGEDMLSKRYFAHYAPDGTAPWDFIHKSGYSYKTAGENLAINFTSSKKVLEAWLNSPKHRANILNPTYTEIGVAITKDIYASKQTLFVIQMFGSKLQTEKANDLQKFTWYEMVLLHGAYYITYLYSITVFLLTLSLIAMIFTEASKKHKAHIRYGLYVLLLMIICIAVNTLLT